MTSMDKIGSNSLGFAHCYVPAQAPARSPLLLLHGMGGNEADMLMLGRAIGPERALLSPRGKVEQDGMLRFSRRLAPGMPDADDLEARSDELAAFVAAARCMYELQAPIAVAFSNGATIAAAMLLRTPEALRAAALIRAVVPFETKARPDLSDCSVLIISGAMDPVASPESGQRLARMLEAAGATVQFELLQAGHRVTPRDIALTSEWLMSQS